jgi:acyl carrier protein
MSGTARGIEAAAGEREQKGEETTETIILKVQEAFKAAFSVEPQSITIDTTPKDVPAWDSMGHVALASSLEQVFGFSFDVDEVMEMENVREIVRIVEAKLVAQVA